MGKKEPDKSIKPTPPQPKPQPTKKDNSVPKKEIK